ncbi:MAG: hypothetical protein AAFP90_15210 [Planctomycetota bacterium]
MESNPDHSQDAFAVNPPVGEPAVERTPAENPFAAPLASGLPEMMTGNYDVQAAIRSGVDPSLYGLAIPLTRRTARALILPAATTLMVFGIIWVLLLLVMGVFGLVDYAGDSPPGALLLWVQRWTGERFFWLGYLTMLILNFVLTLTLSLVSRFQWLAGARSILILGSLPVFGLMFGLAAPLLIMLSMRLKHPLFFRLAREG